VSGSRRFKDRSAFVFIGSAEQEVLPVLLNHRRPDYAVILLFGLDFRKQRGIIQEIEGDNSGNRGE